MILTINEAKGKVCPIRHCEAIDSLCLGDGCACWRWEGKPYVRTWNDSSEWLENNPDATKEEIEKALDAWNPPMPEGAGWELESKEIDCPYDVDCFVVQWNRETDPERKGYCGLAIRRVGIE